jgi:membrane protein insertase Oxa1/YidC/SpoIIIJ
MMLWMMPLMFTVLALSFPSGLALFWVTSSVFRIVLQYRISGWAGLRREAGQEAEKEKKYVKFVASEEQKSVDDVGADIVITDKQQKPGKMRYLPGKDRAQRRRKK